jgi:hypothetical protein
VLYNNVWYEDGVSAIQSHVVYNVTASIIREIMVAVLTPKPLKRRSTSRLHGTILQKALSHLHTRRREKLKSHSFMVFYMSR